MRKKKIDYSKKLVCFDIETTHEVIEGADCLYTWHWQVSLSDPVNRDPRYFTFCGWKQFYDTMLAWCDRERIIIFVHNLSYEIESICRNLCGHEIVSMFAADTHQMIKCVIDDKLEFRCSYLLTNKSLAQCGKDVGIPKLDMDYKKVRRPGQWPPVPESDLRYCVNDVLIMDAKIRQLEEQEGLNFWEFPLTNTGFLRTESRKAALADKKQHKLFVSTQLDYKKFMLCRDSFCGGFVHANYMYAGIVVPGVDSYDFGSAYPFAMLVHLFPMTPFYFVKNPTAKDLNDLLRLENMLFICRVVIKNANGLPVVCKYRNTFLSLSKCKTTDDVIEDNGRIQSATAIETACTSLDWQIIRQVYDFDSVLVKELMWCKAGYLPSWYLNIMLKYYKQKQDLKGVEGQEINYMKAKNRVNSFYGMCVTSPLHDVVTLDGTEWQKDRLDYSDEEIITDELNKFYKNWNNFLPYQWGVFVPAYTRYHLWNDIIIPNDKNVVYCDTDSAKVINREECLPAIDKYNKWAEGVRKARLEKLGFEDFPDLGQFDYETKKTGAVEFKTLGAKKYLYRTQDGLFHLTVAGLSKSAVRYIKGFDDFEPGTIFLPDVSGRTVSRCIDNPAGADVPDRGGCWIDETTYRLSYSIAYETLLAERDGLILSEWRERNSDLIIGKDRRYRGKMILPDDDTIDFTVIKDKRNLYGVRL